MQRHELDARLGDDHGLTEDQITGLLATAGDIEKRYPDPDDRDEREAAFVIAYRLMTTDPETVADDLAGDLVRARSAESRALAGIRQAAVTVVRVDRAARGIESQAGFADRFGVDRMTVRGWLGLR